MNMLFLNMIAITLCSMALVVSGLIALFERDDSDARALGIIMSIVLIISAAP
jgi:hypothetical protein